MSAAVRPERRIIVAGLVDSLGLSLGWTVFVLVAVTRDGLVIAGLYNAAMFVGVMASAPVASRLAHRLSGRAFLATVGAVELVLRLGSLAALLAGAPPYAVAALVGAMNVATWSGYAGMRAEIAEVNAQGRTMTQYAVAVTAIEAVGTMLAALLPIMSGGGVHAGMMAVVFVLYGASLAPQFWCAHFSRVSSGRAAEQSADVVVLDTARVRRAPRGRRKLYLAGGLLMLIASGPATLSTPLAQELEGHLGVVLSAAAVCVGCLAAPAIGDRVRRVRLPMRVTWPLWGIGMVIGWTLAPLGLPGLLVAQASSAAAVTAWQAEMDTTVAVGSPGRATSALAWSTSIRAGGSAVAARLLPLLVTAPQVGVAGAVVCVVLLAAAVGGSLAMRPATVTVPLGEKAVGDDYASEAA